MMLTINSRDTGVAEMFSSHFGHEFMLTLNFLRTQLSHRVSNQTRNSAVFSFYKGKTEITSVEAIVHLRVEAYQILPQKHQGSQF